jgi:ABC-type nitrate/sulfonate/bicarbonate transport system substrate-binding protein
MADDHQSVASGSQLTSVYLTHRPVPTALAVAVHSGVLHGALSEVRLSVDRLDSDEPTPPDSWLRELDGFAVICAGAAGARARVVGITWIQEFQALVTLPGSRIRSVRDLRNRRIALPVSPPSSRAHARRVASLALEVGGLRPREMEWVDLTRAAANAEDGASDAMLPGCPVEYAVVIAALAAGKVDVAHVQGLRGLQAMRSCGAQSIFSATDHPDRRIRAQSATPMCLTVDRHAEDRTLEQANRLLECIRAVGVWARSHSREVARNLSRHLGVPENDIFHAFGAKFYQHLIPDFAAISAAALEKLEQFVDRSSFSVERDRNVTSQGLQY